MTNGAAVGRDDNVTPMTTGAAVAKDDSGTPVATGAGVGRMDRFGSGFQGLEEPADDPQAQPPSNESTS